MKYNENRILGACRRSLQLLARIAPGATSLRVYLHRLRGVKIGANVWIGYDAIIETSYPYLVTIRDGVSIGIRVTIIAHFRESNGVTIEEDAFIGPGVLILPGVTIGRGAVVTAGSVVTQSVPAMSLVQGNPAKTIARVGIPLRLGVSMKEFSRHLKPIGK
jgi:acetyltransferase-like isoleucine patch superfamily enzyme